MSVSKVFRVIAGGALVIAMTAYTQTSTSHGAVVFLLGFVIFLTGFFAGEDY
ncbi:hypothetical protein [Pseudomonas putida]|uniref:hypothetical protein n=1 Tax=Pseudomonas putida TaxID=303 RepID=UPI000AD06BB8|nr:hypothetical protein [Pseudomonas putida]